MTLAVNHMDKMFNKLNDTNIYPRNVPESLSLCDSTTADQSVPLASDTSDDGEWSVGTADNQRLFNADSPGTNASSAPGSPTLARKSEGVHSIDSSISQEKPPYSFPCLIGLALKASETGSLCVRDIYAYIVKNFPYYLTAKSGWKNSVRHNLSLNKYFTKVLGKETSAKSSLWTIAPMMHESLDRDIKQCISRYPKFRRRESCVDGSASPLRRSASHPIVSVNLPNRPPVSHSSSLSSITLSTPAVSRQLSFEGVSFPTAQQITNSVNILNRLNSQSQLQSSEAASWLPPSSAPIAAPLPSNNSLEADMFESFGSPYSIQSIDDLLLSSCNDDLSLNDMNLFSDLLLDEPWTPSQLRYLI